MINSRRLIPLLVCFVTFPSMGQEVEKKPDERAESVKSMLRFYVEAFNKKDLDTVSALWAEDCTYHDRSTGEHKEGREAIRADLKAVFDGESKMQLSTGLDRLRFITDSVVQADGQTLVQSPGTEPLAAHFTAILVKDGENWKISSLIEMAIPKPASAEEALKELEWLIGHWVDEGETSRVETVVRWAPGGAFLLRSYAVTTEEGTSPTGTQVIGWDPRAKEIRSWAFNADGSFGEGRWSKNGEDWLIKSAQTMADGRAASGTYVITSVDDETIQMQLIGHTIAGAPQPASDAVVMKRQQEEPAEPAGKQATDSAKETE